MFALGDYAGPADPDLLTARSFDAHPTGTADLFGMWLAILHETDSGRRLAEATVKRLIGGDAVKGAPDAGGFLVVHAEPHIRHADQPPAGDRRHR
jgi:hypothetical protein